MKRDSVFRQGVFSVEADETLADAASKMQLEEIGSLAVLQQGRFAGIITGATSFEPSPTVSTPRAPPSPGT